MNSKNFFAAFACVVLAIGMLGCGTSNELKSIQLSTSNASATPPGTLNLQGIGTTQQLYLWGNYSDGKQRLLNTGGGTSYQVAVTPQNPNAVDPSNGSFYPLSTPPDTIEVSATGLLTAVQPSACTWFNSAAGTSASTAAWSIVGSYSVTATYGGFTSPPVFVAMASAPGVFDANNNTSGACGPSSS